MEELQEDAGPQRTQVEQLPSNVRYYGRFKGNRGTCESDGWPQQMKQKWGSEPSIKEHEDKIIKGLCYVQSMKSSKDASKFCDFFYFWLGEMFWNSSNKASFERIMQKIKEAVKVSQSYHGCNFEPPVNHGQYFTEWKRVYDLSVDCSRMQGGLYESTALFTEVYYNHLEEAVKAYNTVCTNDTREDEAPCKRIEAALGKNEHGKVLQLESETETVSKELAQSLHRRQYQGEKLSVGTTIYKNVCFGFSTTSTGDLTCSTTEEQRRGEAQGRDSGERHHERSHRDPVPAITQVSTITTTEIIDV
ncbi:Kir-like protein [Plasmodium coatneyi]|uniref:Kir-like protein n=1 Tax=Plasmodium coatneyi TaxID=208452 RepID=A0A1B1E000_9APIC|nr:Kir-like protein [Plasmodium coatneyi]ANQ08177.1 Kir-like protein [Plasmodium coatneyi]